MPQHYPKNTESATYFCNVCMRNTMHNVYDGRLGPCTEHAPKEKVKPKPKPEQKELF